MRGKDKEMEKKTEKSVGTVVQNGAKITVLGVGGAGGNALNNMINSGLNGVKFVAANTDFQALDRNLAPNKIQLGMNLTKGLGAGGNPEVGGKAAQEDLEKIRAAVDGSDMVFITAGLGGGTGTGAAPVAAQVCKELGALTVAVVTKPFLVEGRVRSKNADEGLKALQGTVDTLITIPNNRLVSLADRKATFLEMIKKADDVLMNAVKGISDLITKDGHINADFNDVKTVMSEMGLALMGTGVGRGENRASQAVQQAISSPLLEDVSIHGARAALVNISASRDLGMHEFDEAFTLIHKEVSEEANIIIGMVFDDSMGDELRVTVIATGIGRVEQQHKLEATQNSSPRPRRVNPDGIIPELNYDYLQVPTVMRHRSARDPQAEAASESQQPQKKRTFLQKLTGSTPEEEDLSIPTFIRRQLD